MNKYSTVIKVKERKGRPEHVQIHDYAHCTEQINKTRMASASTSDKLEDCEVCGATKAKYTCPKCEVRTCSLVCVNLHKKELDCDGIRDKTKFIPLTSFGDLDLLSDYRFLEQVGRLIDTKKRNPEKKYIRQTNLPVHLHKLRCAASRKKVSLLFMPQIFNRHKENTTFLNWKTNELFWRIKWIFPQAQNVKWVVERTPDTARLSTLVEQVLDPISSGNETDDIEKLNIKLALADKLQFYRAAGLTSIKVLLKAEKVKKANSKFYNLDLTLTLQENLEDKTIVEFPTLYVIMKDHSDIYEIIDTDEETSDTECSNLGARKRRKNGYDKKDEPVNYFFNDFSESDDEKLDKKKQKETLPDLDIPNYEEL